MMLDVDPWCRVASGVNIREIAKAAARVYAGDCRDDMRSIMEGMIAWKYS
jgi:hypothetical protein